MTDRERWTVYPLLFLALGISLKDKMTQSVSTDQVRCKKMICDELIVAKPDEPKAVRIAGGEVVASGDLRAPALICNLLVVATPEGKEMVRLAFNDDGGFVRTIGSQTDTQTVLGQIKQYSGVMIIDAHGNIHSGPTYVSPLPVRRKKEQPPQSESAEEPQSEPVQSEPAGKAEPKPAETEASKEE